MRALASAKPPLALAVLSEELESISARFRDIAFHPDQGAKRALSSDLVRAIDRYVRLELEVLYPVLERFTGPDPGAARRHAALHAALLCLHADLADDKAYESELQALEAAFRAHRSVQEADTFERAGRLLGDELPGLALELDEVRQRMRGAYGV